MSSSSYTTLNPFKKEGKAYQAGPQTLIALINGHIYLKNERTRDMDLVRKIIQEAAHRVHDIIVGGEYEKCKLFDFINQLQAAKDVACCSIILGAAIAKTKDNEREKEAVDAPSCRAESNADVKPQQPAYETVIASPVARYSPPTTHVQQQNPVCTDHSCCDG